MKLKLLLRPAGHSKKVQTIATTKFCGASDSQSSKKGPQAKQTFDTAVLRTHDVQRRQKFLLLALSSGSVLSGRSRRPDQWHQAMAGRVSLSVGDPGGRSFGSRHCTGCIVVDPSVHQYFPRRLRLPLRIAIDRDRFPCDLCAWADTYGHSTPMASARCNCPCATGVFPLSLAPVRGPAPARARAHARGRNPSLPNSRFQHPVAQHTLLSTRTALGKGNSRLSQFESRDRQSSKASWCRVVRDQMGWPHGYVGGTIGDVILSDN